MKPFNVYLAIIICIASFSANSQNRTLTGADAKKLVKESDKIMINEKRSTLSFIHLAPDHFVSQQQNVSWLRRALSLTSSDDVKLYKTENDNIGYTHFRYRETFKGVTVQYG